MPEPIPEAKLRGLRESLGEGGKVTFKSGATIEAEVRYVVTTPLGAKQRFTGRELRAAYALALRGPAPLPQPATEEELTAAYGKDAPF